MRDGGLPRRGAGAALPASRTHLPVLRDTFYQAEPARQGAMKSANIVPISRSRNDGNVTAVEHRERLPGIPGIPAFPGHRHYRDIILIGGIFQSAILY